MIFFLFPTKTYHYFTLQIEIQQSILFKIKIKKYKISIKRKLDTNQYKETTAYFRTNYIEIA